MRVASRKLRDARSKIRDTGCRIIDARYLIRDAGYRILDTRYRILDIGRMEILEEKPIRVHAYSGYKANERPLRFTFEGREYDVEKILDRWYGQDYDYFKVRTRDGLVRVIKWQRWLDAWFLVEKR